MDGYGSSVYHTCLSIARSIYRDVLNHQWGPVFDEILNFLSKRNIDKKSENIYSSNAQCQDLYYQDISSILYSNSFGFEQLVPTILLRTGYEVIDKLYVAKLLSEKANNDYENYSLPINSMDCSTLSRLFHTLI